jgi:hypothetical protein
MLRRAVDSLSTIGEDVSPEVLNKLKAMETSSRQVGNIAEADAFLNKVRQYEPSYKPGSHDYGTYGPNAARVHGQPYKPESWTSGTATAAQAARNKAWQDFVRSRYSNRRYQQSYRKYNQATGESGGRTRGKAKPKSSTSSSSSSTSSAPSSKAPVDRKAAAKKAWETMRAKRSAAAGKAADSTDLRGRMHRALDRILDWRRGRAA